MSTITETQRMALLDKYAKMMQAEIDQLESGLTQDEKNELAGYRNKGQTQPGSNDQAQAKAEQILKEIDQAEADEMDALRQRARGPVFLNSRQNIAHKYADLRAQVQQATAADQATDPGTTNVQDLQRQYVEAKAKIKRGDRTALGELKRTYRAKFARLGYNLND